MEDTLTTLYCIVDDFCKDFIPAWNRQLLEAKSKKRCRKSKLSISEAMTIYIHFHQSNFRCFKHYYLHYVQNNLCHIFPELVSYPRFVAMIKSLIVPLYFFMHSLTGQKTGIYFVDSTILKVCHIKREKQNKVFKDLAKKSKSSMGWFFGFKLHLVVNDKGEIMAFRITQGNNNDRKPVPSMMQNLFGRLFGDKGYISKKLAAELMQKGIKLVTKVKKNMKKQFLPTIEKILLRKRAIIETVNDQLKNICQVEHSRHRSHWNFFANILAALVAYAVKSKKPSLNLKYQMVI